MARVSSATAPWRSSPGVTGGASSTSPPSRASSQRSGRLRRERVQPAVDPPASRDVGTEGAVAFLEPDRDDRTSVRSAAVLRILGRLGFGWALLGPLASIPGLSRLLDVPYRWIARNRDRWFGRDDACLVPSPELRARFLEP